MITKNLKFAANELVGSSKFLFPLIAPRLYGAIVTPETNLCIAGPPRSANTYAHDVFRMLNPDAKVAHHNHTPMQVINAVKWNVPCIVPLRHPLDTLASVILVDERLSMTLAIRSYLNFYTRIQKVRDQMVISPFETIVNDFHIVVKQVNIKYGCVFQTAPLTDEQEDQIKQTIKARRTRIKKHPLLVAVPTAEKEEKKKRVKESLLSHRLYAETCEVYERWIAFAQDQ